MEYEGNLEYIQAVGTWSQTTQTNIRFLTDCNRFLQCVENIMSAASAAVHDQNRLTDHSHSISHFLSGVLVRCTIRHVVSFCLGCMLSQSIQSDISNELHVLGQCLLHISVIPSLRSFPPLPGARCNCCSFLLTLSVYTVLITDVATHSDPMNHNIQVLWKERAYVLLCIPKTN